MPEAYPDSVQPATMPSTDADIPATGRPAKKSGYMPTLDGWRALAILCVLLAHAYFPGQSTRSINHRTPFGELGVEVFFALSGLLICGRLLDEERLTGNIHIKGFYIRRIFRIQPPALVYVAFLAILTACKLIPVFLAGLLASVLLVRNYFGTVGPLSSLWPTGHFWSLSVEEHFYLILPGLLFFIKKRRAETLFALGLVSLLWRFYLEAHGHLSYEAKVRTDTTICLLFFPAAISVLLQDERLRILGRKFLHCYWVLPAALLFLPTHSPVHMLRGLVAPLIVLSTMFHPGTLIGKFLESAPLRFVGRISYSLYLWQMIFLTAASVPEVHPFGWLHRSLLVWPCLFLTAIASHYFIERPLMRWGHRLAPSATSGRVL
jgi:peptidoglycan/LPS O-acetylase OafA/YrhL